MLSENSPNTAVSFEIAVDPLLRGTFFCYNLKVVPLHVKVVKLSDLYQVVSTL
jgi:hypothetical protein